VRWKSYSEPLGVTSVYCYTNSNWFLPSVSMSEGELLALLLASRSIEQYKGTPVARELDKVFRKLAELLPDKLSIQPELIFTRFSFKSPPAKPISLGESENTTDWEPTRRMRVRS